MTLETRPSTVSLVCSWAFVLVLPVAIAQADSAPSTTRSATSPSSLFGAPDPELVPSWQRMSGPADIAPPGWQREGARWQRIDGTPLPDSDPGKTLNDLIRRQRSLETGGGPTRFVATLMMYLRALDPITLASAQISAFCLLAYRVLRRD